MNGPFTPVVAGQRFTPSAQLQNDVLNMRGDWKARRERMNADVSPLPLNPAVILVWNQTGNDVDWYGVMGLDNSSSDTGPGPPIDPDDDLLSWQQRPLLTGVLPKVTPGTNPAVPNPAGHRGNFCVALAPIKSGDFGPCAVAGVAQVQIYLDPNLTGVTAADILDSDPTQLTLSPGGCRIVWLQQGDPADTVWGLVDIGNKEGMLYAQQDSSQDGTHPVNQTRLYDLLQPKVPIDILGGNNFIQPLVKVPVMNRIASVASDARKYVAIIQGMYGQYQLIAISTCNNS